MKKLIILLFIARFICVADAQAGYATTVVVPTSFSDTMNWKFNISGTGFVIFYSYHNGAGDNVCDSGLQASFPTEFASLIGTGWVASYDHDGCSDVADCTRYEMTLRTNMMFLRQAAIAATKTISIQDETFTLNSNPQFTPLPKFTTTTSADFTFGVTAAYELHTVYVGSIAGGRSIRIGTAPGGSDVLTATAITSGNTYSFTIDKIFPSTTTLYASDPTTSAQSINFIARFLK